MYRTESVEDQQKFIVPLNRETEKLFYNQRIILDAFVETEPRCWKLTKINRLGNEGLNLVTLYQDIFDQHKDYIERDKYGNIIGMWADYFEYPLEEEDDTVHEVYSSITYSGVKPEIKIGGNYKKFTVQFYDHTGVPISLRKGSWLFHVNDEDVAEMIELSNEELKENEIKIKFVGSELFIGKILKISYESDDGIVSSVEMNIVGL